MAGTWTSLDNQPTFNTSTMILLTDGRVMVQEEGTAHWHALTPDSTGSYIAGTWSTLKDMSFWRRYYASGVMKDGRVFLCGGEQNGEGGATTIPDSNKGEIYDPVLDKWTAIAVPPWTQVGDAASCVLPDGRIIIGALTTGSCLIYDPTTNAWSATGSQSGQTGEETWILLPDNTILAPQCYSPYRAQKYVISSGTWQDEGPPGTGALPAPVVDQVMHEIGPGMLLYNKKVIFFGAANNRGHGRTLLYTMPASPTGTGTWTAGPDIPVVGGQAIVSNDCPATLMPDGKVLFTAANFLDNNWGSPVLFFEYDPTTNKIAQAPTPSNNATFPYSGAANAGIYWSRMMLLPNGQVLFSASSGNVQVYKPDGGPQDAWRPTITAVTPHGAPYPDYYVVQGTQLNGLSQANIYGDDCYPATNYPLAQLTNSATHEVYYCRTHDFSTMGVATGTTLQSCRFTPDMPGGVYDLRIIANGIASQPVSVSYTKPTKLQFREVSLKLEFEQFGKLVAEGDPFKFIDLGDPEINQMRQTLKTLGNSVQRLSSLIQASGLPAVGQGTAMRAGANQIRKEQAEADEHDDGDDQNDDKPGKGPGKPPNKKK
jgi:hypothetical protein